MGKIKKFHYKQRCHDPCYLDNVPKDIVGAPQLRHCAAIDRTTGLCHKCTCDFSAHMHIYYMTKVVEAKHKDDVIEKNINSKEIALMRTNELIDKIRKRKLEMEREHSVIVKVTAYCGHFMRVNAITSFNDSYKHYIEYLIDREKSQGENCDILAVRHLEKLLNEYDQTLKTLDEASNAYKKLNNNTAFLKPNDIQKEIESLFNLKHFGAKIKEMYSSQKTAHKKEHEYTEYIHKNVSTRSSAPPPNKNKPKKSKILIINK